MSTTPKRIEELLELAIALAKSSHNLEMMERATVLHGYLELTKLDPHNYTYRKKVQDAVASLLELTG